MSALVHRATALSCATLVVLSASALASADPDTPRLPRPRPVSDAAPSEQAAAIEDQPRLPHRRPAAQTEAGLGRWAEDLQDRFRVAGLQQEGVPTVATATPSSGSALAAIEEVARLPHARPEHPPALLAMAPADATVVVPAAPLAPPVPGPEDIACLARIDALGVTYKKADPIDPDGPCFVDHPLTVSGVGSGVTIVPDATLNCRTAEALALWTRDVLVPSARDILNATPTKIVHDSTYVCRHRNNDPEAKISEHAHANAVDIGSVAFAERQPFDIADRDMASLEGRFQVAIRGGSCDYFTTVLGPRSNAAHATHFHFDMAERRGGYRLCDLADTNFVGPAEP